MKTFENLKKGVANVILEMEKEFGSDTPLSTADILLMIPYNGSMSVQKVRQTSTMSEAGVSRALSTLNAHNCCNRRKFEKLIEIYTDEKDRRYKHVKLTRRGRDIVGRFMSPLESFYMA